MAGPRKPGGLSDGYEEPREEKGPRGPRGPNTEDIRKRNKATVRRVLQAFNTGNLREIEEAHSPALVDFTPGIRAEPNPRGVHKQAEMFRSLFPDVNFREDFIIAEGDMVVLRWEMTGTHKGRLFGREGTGRKITYHGHEILRLDDEGRIVEHTDTFNVVTFLDMLGLMDGEMLQRIKQAGVLSRGVSTAEIGATEELVVADKSLLFADATLA